MSLIKKYVNRLFEDDNSSFAFNIAEIETDLGNGAVYGTVYGETAFYPCLLLKDNDGNLYSTRRDSQDDSTFKLMYSTDFSSNKDSILKSNLFFYAKSLVKKKNRIGNLDDLLFSYLNSTKLKINLSTWNISSALNSIVDYGSISDKLRYCSFEQLADGIVLKNNVDYTTDSSSIKPSYIKVKSVALPVNNIPEKWAFVKPHLENTKSYLKECINEALESYILETKKDELFYQEMSDRHLKDIVAVFLKKAYPDDEISIGDIDVILDRALAASTDYDEFDDIMKTARHGYHDDDDYKATVDKGDVLFDKYIDNISTACNNIAKAVFEKFFKGQENTLSRQDALASLEKIDFTKAIASFKDYVQKQTKLAEKALKRFIIFLQKV